jgi:BON domain/YMGG-like Gly-zipper
MRLRSILAITVLAGVVAAGCARKSDDAALVTNIKAQMFSDSQLKGASLQVASKDGQVTLTGTVPSDAARLDAYKIATQTPGVSKVNDQMTVKGAQTTENFAAAQTSEPPQSQAAPEAQTTPVAEAAPPPSAKKTERERRRKERARAHERETAEAAQNQTDSTPPDQETAAPPPPPQQPQDQTSQAPAAPAVASTPSPAQVQAPVPAPPPPPQPAQVQIPAGTTMSIRMIDGVDSSVNQPGEIFHASLDAPIVVGDQVVVPKDADVYVRLASASSAGRVSGRSELRLELVKLEFQGQSYPLDSSTYALAGSSRGKDTAKKVGIGAVLGTVIGAVAGGGKGAAIGAAAGAGAGGAYQAATRGKQVKIPSETKLDFQLEQPVTVTVMPRSSTTGQ